MNATTSKASVYIRFLRVTILLVVLGWMTGFASYVHLIHNYANDFSDTKLNAIIVLTGGGQRIERGLELLNEDHAEHLYITGVDPRVSTEALLDARGTNLGHLKDKVTLGTMAIDTVSNAQEIKNWIVDGGINNVYLVTSHYHMPRAMNEVVLVNPELHIHPQTVVSQNINYFSFGTWRLMFIEFHKYIYSSIKLFISKGHV